VRKLIAFALILLLCLPAIAADGWQVKYAGGTVPGMNVGVVGTLDTTSETSLTFAYAGNKLAIPYASIESFDHAEEAARHLGVLPAIIVGLLKARQHRHFFRISYHGPNDVAQVAVFEVPKHMPRPLQAVLDARAPHDAHPAQSDKSCLPCSHQD
jgi:hypothetical protein